MRNANFTIRMALAIRPRVNNFFLFFNALFTIRVATEHAYKTAVFHYIYTGRPKKLHVRTFITMNSEDSGVKTVSIYLEE